MICRTEDSGRHSASEALVGFSQGRRRTGQIPTPAALSARTAFCSWVLVILRVLRISDAVAGLITSTRPFAPLFRRAFVVPRRSCLIAPFDRFTVVCILFKLHGQQWLARDFSFWAPVPGQNSTKSLHKCRVRDAGGEKSKAERAKAESRNRVLRNEFSAARIADERFEPRR